MSRLSSRYQLEIKCSDGTCRYEDYQYQRDAVENLKVALQKYNNIKSATVYHGTQIVKRVEPSTKGYKNV